MTAAVLPEMLWESADPQAELARRFRFVSPEAAVRWARDLLADDYGLRVASIDRIVMSSHNLMIWVTSRSAGRLVIKACHLAGAHGWLTARGALVVWLADRGLPVAAPLPTLRGDHQVLRDGRSIAVQPVLPGDLLDATDAEHVRAAGTALAALHSELALWPDAHLLENVQPVAGGNKLWVYPEGHSETIPPDLRDRRDRLALGVVDLPELPRQPIHADFRGANVLYADGRISGIIDFEESRNDAAVVDLANAVCLLGTWYHDWQPISRQAQSLFLASYAERRPLTDAEHAWLSPLIGWVMLRQGWWDDARHWLP